MRTRVKTKKIIYALIDISGTIQRGNGKPVNDDAIDAIHRLMESLGQCNVLFLTNTTTVSRKTLLQELCNNGFSNEITLDHIMTGSQAVCYYVQKYQLNPYCLVEDDLIQDLTFINNTTSITTHHDKQQQYHDEDQEQQYDSVVVGLSPSHFHYHALNRAFRILYKQYSNSSEISSKNSKHRLLCYHRSQYVKDVDGQLSLGPGSFISGLEDALIASINCLNKDNFSAHILGKPSIGFYQAALQQLIHGSNNSSSRNDTSSLDDIDPDCEMSPNHHEYANVVMIGDDYRNDIIGALNVQIGYQILVQTGKYLKGDELKIRNHPGYESNTTICLPSIVEAVDHILAINEKC